MRHSQSRSSWRPVALIVCLSLMLNGCAWLHRMPRPRNPFASPPPCVLKPAATKEEVIAHLNANISRLTGWRSSRVGIHLKQQGYLPVDLTGDMAVESPTNFRLRVSSSLLGEQADFGSNPERFWFWIKQSPQPFVMTARHDQMHVAQQRLPLPFEPLWVMEAMGVVLLNPDDYEMELVSESRVNLVSRSFAPTGEPVTKVIGVDLCLGQMVEHSLYDPMRALLARATMSRFTANSEGVTVPNRIKLEWPEAGTTLDMSFLTTEINPGYTPEATWTLPDSIAPVVDIGKP